ncbi:MAG TPA: hypothetical protein DCQ06_05925 [Myxococcales bacterium]|nr:hypothetical protein [Myxococcales bacterium]
MATVSSELIVALRTTAARLDSRVRYQWTHMGACNCGHLAQTVTELDQATIHRIALERAGDWGEQVVEYCPASGLPIDHVITSLLELGLSTSDLRHLERLSDRDILSQCETDTGWLDHRRRSHVVHYLRVWAGMLQAEFERSIQTVQQQVQSEAA